MHLQSIQPINGEQEMRLTKSGLTQRFEKLPSAQQANASISQCGYLRIKYTIKTSFNARALFLHTAAKSLGHKYSLSCLDTKSYDILLYTLLIA